MCEDQQATSRFIDNEFSTKALSPICGYWSDKLVSLEQALKPIEPCVEQLDRSIKAAKKYCHFPSEHGLTQDESAALYLYTMEGGGTNSFYRVLNQALNSEDRPALKVWFPYLKLLDTALAKLPTVRRNLWRGVIGDVGLKLKKDQELTWWTISSCSLSINVVKDFLSTDTPSTLFLIEALHGKDISRYTNYPDEDEVLLGPGSQLRVVSNAVDLPGGFSVVHLAEIDGNRDEPLPTTDASSQLTSKTETQDNKQLRNKPSISHLSLPLTSKKSHLKSQRSTPTALPCGGRAIRSYPIRSTADRSISHVVLSVVNVDEQHYRGHDRSST